MLFALSGEQRLAATGEPWITTTALDVRLNGFLDRGVATEAMLLCLFACECNLQTDCRGSFRLPVDL